LRDRPEVRRRLPRALRAAGVVSAVLAVLGWPAAFAADRALGRDVVVVAPHAPEDALARRAVWEAEGRPGDDRDVASLHGTWLGAERVLAKEDDGRLLRPAEKPSLLLYRVAAGARPVQARTAWFLARALAAAGAGAAVLLFVAAGLSERVAVRRAARAARPPRA
jgi:hypothetical protein